MDKKITIAASKGDVKAFSNIYDMYVSKMRYVCGQYCRREAEIDDVLQESFIKVHENIKKYKFKGSFQGWIRRIVVYTAINHYKRKKQIYFEEHDLLQDEQVKEALDYSIIVENDQ